MRVKGKHIVWILGVVIVGFACNSAYTVKPKGYYRIDFPSHVYQRFDQPGYPYSFDYPVYAQIARDSSFFKDMDTPFWVNIEFPSLQGKIYLSYKTIGEATLEKLVNDAFVMTYKHTSKASSIRDSLFRTPNGNSGIWFDVGGNAATGKQFFITDSTRHFLRGALYFDTTPNADSLNIVYDFLQVDMFRLINSLRWKSVIPTKTP
jgi:gliding motility-associated lipoprotein GldD